MSRGFQRLVLLSAESRSTCADWYEPFNYSVRKIEAAVRGDPSLAHIEPVIVDATGDSAEQCAQRLAEAEPDLIGVSTYYWSFPALCRAVRLLKRRLPECIVIFGGPSAAPEMFSVPGFTDGGEYVDALVLNEGELVIRHVLSLPDNTRAALRQVPGLAVAESGGGWHNTGPGPLPVLDELPSPLQMGLLPPGTSGHLETFRGCPMSCSFCEWGESQGFQRAFSRDYLTRELRALKSFGPKGIFLIDAGLNLNAKAFRNLAAAEEEVGVLRLHPVHTECYPSHLNEAQLQFLSDISIASVGIGLQSYDEEVNRRLGRPHDAARFERVVSEVLSVAGSTWIEIILGLPGDNPQNFMTTLERARKLGAGVRVARCLVLPKALLSHAPAHFDMDFDPETLLMQSCWGWPGDSIDETAHAVEDLVMADGGVGGAGMDYWAFPQTSPGSPKYGWTELMPASPAAAGAKQDAHLQEVEDGSGTNAAQANNGGGREADSGEVADGVDAQLSDAWRAAVASGSRSQWALVEAELFEGQAELTVSIVAAPEETFIVRIEPADQAADSYTNLGDLAFSYKEVAGRSLPSFSFETLEKVMAELHDATLRDGGANRDLCAQSPTV